jgi:maltose alpha-D-glucosyltransferase/alpha-amylase
MRRFVDEHYPGRILLAEANQWPQDLRPYFGEGDEFHMAFHFPVMPRIFMALAQADARPVVEIMSKTPPIPANAQWCTFLRNHDELTLEMVTEEERQWMWQHYAPEPRMRLNLGIRRRLAPLLDGDRHKIELAHSILFSLPGSPILYYGDEIGMGNNIGLDDRDGVRTPMQWEAGPNAGFSGRGVPPERLYAPLIDDERFGYRAVNVAAQRADAGSLWHTLRHMIAVRKQHPAFSRGECEFLPLNTHAALAFRRTAGDKTILALHNLSPAPHTIQLDLSRWKGEGLRDLLSGRVYPQISETPYTFALQAHEYVWLKIVGS